MVHRISENLSDVRAFGPRFLLRHLSRRSTVTIPGFGPINIRRSSSDLTVVRQIFKERQYAIPCHITQRVTEHYEKIIRSNKVPVIVDAGANIGASAIWFAKTFPAAAVVAVEPEPNNAKLLRENVSSSVRVIESAVGSAAGFVHIADGDTGWGVTTERSSAGIPVITMQEAFHSVENGCPFLAKIDIEGFEQELFATNLSWLDEIQIMFLEPHDWRSVGQRNSRTFQRAMAERYFDLLLSGENLIYVR